MNNINAYHSSNDTDAQNEPKTDFGDINPHLKKRVKRVGVEENHSFNETTSTQSVSNTNLDHRSHDTNVQSEMRTDFGDTQLPIEKSINHYGISIDSLPIKKAYSFDAE